MKACVKILVFTAIFTSAFSHSWASGSDVSVLFKDSTQINGELLAMTDSLIVIEVDKSVRYDGIPTTVETIEVRRIENITLLKADGNNAVVTGSLMGAAVGGLGSLLILTGDSEPHDVTGKVVYLVFARPAMYAVAGIVFLGATAGGALIGLLSHTDPTLFVFDMQNGNILMTKDQPVQMKWETGIKALQQYAKYEQSYPADIKNAIDKFLKGGK